MRPASCSGASSGHSARRPRKSHKAVIHRAGRGSRKDICPESGLFVLLRWGDLTSLFVTVPLRTSVRGP